LDVEWWNLLEILTFFVADVLHSTASVSSNEPRLRSTAGGASYKGGPDPKSARESESDDRWRGDLDDSMPTAVTFAPGDARLTF